MLYYILSNLIKQGKSLQCILNKAYECMLNILYIHKDGVIKLLILNGDYKVYYNAINNIGCILSFFHVDDTPGQFTFTFFIIIIHLS